MQSKTLEIGGNCFVRRPNDSFAGIVMELSEKYVRVMGKGDHEWSDEKGTTRSSYFDEWFPKDSPLCWVTAA